MSEKTKKTISWTIFFSLAFLIVGAGLYPFWFPAVKANTTSTVTSQVEVGNATPTVSDVTLTLPTLAENTSTTATCTATIVDDNGGSTVNSATATVYRSGVDSSCSADNNNCYTQIACSLGNIDGNTVYATCTIGLWFHADPTDAGTYSGEDWNCDIIAKDDNAATATNTEGVERNLATLNAIQITSSIDYTTLTAGATSADSETTIATTTGNAALDLLASSTDMYYDSVVIPGDKQAYFLSDEPYESMTSCSTTSYDEIEAVLVKPYSSPSTSTDTIYWKIGIPDGQDAGTYYSTTSIVATPDD